MQRRQLTMPSASFNLWQGTESICHERLPANPHARGTHRRVAFGSSYTAQSPRAAREAFVRVAQTAHAMTARPSAAPRDPSSLSRTTKCSTTARFSQRALSNVKSRAAFIHSIRRLARQPGSSARFIISGRLTCVRVVPQRANTHFENMVVRLPAVGVVRVRRLPGASELGLNLCKLRRILFICPRCA